jgi:hypothetical protein
VTFERVAAPHFTVKRIHVEYPENVDGIPRLPAVARRDVARADADRRAYV